MRRVLIFFLTLCAVTAGCAAQEQEPVALALEVLDGLAAGEWDAVYARSTAQLQSAVGSAAGFSDVWTRLTGMLGEFSAATAEADGETDGCYLVSARCAFSRATAMMSLSFSEAGELASIAITGMEETGSAESEADGYIEEAIELRAGAQDATGGIVTLPEGGGPFPAVILVHGSGASDMDETALANAPFRDLAHGLARLGVASIRYDKYTYAHPELASAADFTIEGEYLADARSAADLLARDARIDEIYVLGHSQGAMLAPRIMAVLREEIGARLAGGVLLAGTPLHLWQIQYRQNLDVLETLTGAQREQAQALIDAELAKVDALADLSGEELQKQTLFGISACYQLDEMSVDAIETAVGLGLPLFIAQGAKDWQVHSEDGIERWRAELPGEFDAVYHLYPDMNHMLADMEGEPTGTMSDYMDADARVSQALIEDIAAWIRTR